MCTELLPPGGYPIAVKYIIYDMISYNIIPVIFRVGEKVPDTHLAGS
jgi:hypothetical protein